jgi:integrase
VSQYDPRHSFCQRLLESGVNHVDVAELFVHANGQMVSTVYSHINRVQAHLREELKDATDGLPHEKWTPS